MGFSVVFNKSLINKLKRLLKQLFSNMVAMIIWAEYEDDISIAVFMLGENSLLKFNQGLTTNASEYNNVGAIVL